jgi:hypothetical protein
VGDGSIASEEQSADRHTDIKGCAEEGADGNEALLEFGLGIIHVLLQRMWMIFATP